LLEISPNNLSGKVGSVNGSFLGFGLMIASLMGFGLPHDKKDKENEFWRIIVLLPSFFSLFYIVMTSIFYYHSTP